MPDRVKRAKRYVKFAWQTSALDDMFTLPIEVRSESNLREHWTMKNKRKREQQMLIKMIFHGKRQCFERWKKAYAAGPIRITFTKLGGRRLDRSNLPVSFKGIEDAFAWLMGCNDGHEHWIAAWEQEPGGPVGIKIRIEAIS